MPPSVPTPKICSLDNELTRWAALTHDVEAVFFSGFVAHGQNHTTAVAEAMSFKCYVPGCTSGYASDTSAASMFEFPHDSRLRGLWLFVELMQTTLCGHQPTAIVFAQIIFRKKIFKRNCDGKKRLDRKLTRRRLRASAIPSIFSKNPKYLTVEKPNARSSASSSERRLEATNSRIEELNNSVLLKDSIVDTDSLKAKINGTYLPSGYVIVERRDCVLLCYATDSSPPKMPLSVTVSEDLTVAVHINGVCMKSEIYHHLLSQDSKVASVVDVANIAAFAKSHLELEDDAQEDKQLLSLLLFLCEQLRLAQVSKHARNYSTSLICTSLFLWQMTSTDQCKKLQDVFLLPSIRRLQQLSQNTSVRPCQLDTKYLTR